MTIEQEIKQPKFRSPQQKVAVNLIYTTNWLEAKQNEFFKAFGLTSSQYNILRILRGQGNNSISGADIKSRMLERNSDISRMLDRLLKKRLVTKRQCPNDKRAADIMIAPAGLSLLSEIDMAIDKTERVNIRLNEKEALQLSALLDKCRGNSF